MNLSTSAQCLVEEVQCSKPKQSMILTVTSEGAIAPVHLSCHNLPFSLLQSSETPAQAGSLPGCHHRSVCLSKLDDAKLLCRYTPVISANHKKRIIQMNSLTYTVDSSWNELAQ